MHGETHVEARDEWVVMRDLSAKTIHYSCLMNAPGALQVVWEETL